MATNHISGYDLLSSMQYNNNTYTVSVSKKYVRTDTDVKAVAEGLQSLRKNMKKLQGYDENTTTKERMEAKMKKFVESYNELEKVKDSVSDSEYQKQMKKLEDLVSENTYDLRKAGIVFNDEGKLEVDEDKLENATAKQLGTIFEGKDSFIATAQRLAKKAYNAVEDKVIVRQQQKKNVSVILGNTEYVVGGSAYLMSNSTTYIGELMAVYEGHDEVKDEYLTKLDAALQTYAGNYEDVMNYSAYYAYDYDRQLEELHFQDENLAALNAIGFSFSDKGILSYTSDRSRFEDADTLAKVHTLFETGSAFSEKVNTLMGKIFKTVMKTDSIGVTVDEFA